MRFLLFLSILFQLTPLSAGVSLKKIASLSDKLHETSGLVFYKDKYLITHNDGGHKSEIYVISKEGKIKRKIDIKDADNDDWEDLACSPDGRLFIGDFGNNENKRKKCQVYILKDGFIKKEDAKAKKISFTYEDQKKYPPKEEDLNFDAEAFIWMNDSLYIFTKCRSKPYTGISNVYVLPDEEGEYEARKVGAISFCKYGWRFCSVTAADYHHASKTLVLLFYTKVAVIKNFTGNPFFQGDVKLYNLSGIKQREAIAFINENEWYMTDEKHPKLGGGNLYHLTKK